MRLQPNLILAAFTLCHLVGCKEQSPEARVRKAFDACVQAVEARDASGAVEGLSKDFQGPEGLDKPGARLYLMGMLRQEKVGITVLGNRVEVKGDQADQAVELMLTSKGEGLLPKEASRRVYRLQWKLEDGEWRLGRLEEGP